MTSQAEKDTNTEELDAILQFVNDRDDSKLINGLMNNSDEKLAPNPSPEKSGKKPKSKLKRNRRKEEASQSKAKAI
jgi:hypothetical protein